MQDKDRDYFVLKDIVYISPADQKKISLLRDQIFNDQCLDCLRSCKQDVSGNHICLDQLKEEDLN